MASEKDKAYRKAYWAVHRERKREIGRKAYAKNKETIKEKYRTGYYKRSRDSEKIKIYMRQYRKDNKEKILILNRTPSRRFMNALKSAKYRGVEWSIPLSEYSEYIKLRCHYCDGALELYGCGLDRKDNSVGYTISNVVSCCRKCNTMKSDHISYDEMVVAMNAIKGFRLKKALGEISGSDLFKSRD